jgi:hypothetical protein
MMKGKYERRLWQQALSHFLASRSTTKRCWQLLARLCIKTKELKIPTTINCYRRPQLWGATASGKSSHSPEANETM